MNKIRELRLKAGLTQIDLANESGVSRITIIRMERGKYKHYKLTLRAIAQALKVPVEELL